MPQRHHSQGFQEAFQNQIRIDMAYYRLQSIQHRLHCLAALTLEAEVAGHAENETGPVFSRREVLDLDELSCMC